jgi:hypothetical protein
VSIYHHRSHNPETHRMSKPTDGRPDSPRKTPALGIVVGPRPGDVSEVFRIDGHRYRLRFVASSSGEPAPDGGVVVGLVGGGAGAFIIEPAPAREAAEGKAGRLAIYQPRRARP